jgi:hypothetical protein
MSARVKAKTPLPRPAPPSVADRAARAEKRLAWRFDKAVPVLLDTGVGDRICVARNVTVGGIFLETRDPLPLGSPVRIRFAMLQTGAEIVATGEVKNHYFLNYSDPTGARSLSGMGVRFTGFEGAGAESLSSTIERARLN